jgi:hypothetical protein
MVIYTPKKDDNHKIKQKNLLLSVRNKSHMIVQLSYTIKKIAKLLPVN